MIVKTGANYQAEGGYIEFARGTGTAIINDNPVPSIVYSDSIMVTSVQKFSITRVAGVSGNVRYINYVEFTAQTGEKFYDYQTTPLDEGGTGTITLPAGFASLITTPTGYHPKLGDEAKNVKLVKTKNNYYIIATGESPNAVIELEANV